MPYNLSPDCTLPSSQYISPDVYQQSISLSDHPSKRSREMGSDGQHQSWPGKQQHQQQQVPQTPVVITDQSPHYVPEQNHSPKKSRPNNYIAPRVVPTTFTSTMGSLVKNGANTGMQKSNTRVQLRRQLSGGKLDAYLGSDDSMDVDNSDSRPRSMSF